MVMGLGLLNEMDDIDVLTFYFLIATQGFSPRGGGMTLPAAQSSPTNGGDHEGPERWPI